MISHRQKALPQKEHEMLELQGLHISHSGSVVWVRLQPSQGVQVLQLLVIVISPPASSWQHKGLLYNRPGRFLYLDHRLRMPCHVSGPWEDRRNG